MNECLTIEVSNHPNRLITPRHVRFHHFDIKKRQSWKNGAISKHPWSNYKPTCSYGFKTWCMGKVKDPFGNMKFSWIYCNLFWCYFLTNLCIVEGAWTSSGNLQIPNQIDNCCSLKLKPHLALYTRGLFHLILY